MLIIYLWKGKGLRVQERGKCHYLLSRFLQHGPFLGQLEWGAHHPPPSQEVGGGARLCQGGSSWGGHGQGGRGLGAVKVASSGGSEGWGAPDPHLQLRQASREWVQPSSGVYGGRRGEAFAALTLAWVEAVATPLGP